MQPMDHMSTGVEYSFCPSRISGARYQSVTKIRGDLRTSCVSVFMGTPNARARPKSASLIAPFLSISRFCGFKSRCRMRLLWQYLIAEMIWYRYD